MERLRQEKRQMEKDVEDRSLTFRPDLSLTRRDNKKRGVDEFIRDQESWYCLFKIKLIIFLRYESH